MARTGFVVSGQPGAAPCRNTTTVPIVVLATASLLSEIVPYGAHGLLGECSG